MDAEADPCPNNILLNNVLKTVPSTKEPEKIHTSLSLPTVDPITDPATAPTKDDHNSTGNLISRRPYRRRSHLPKTNLQSMEEVCAPSRAQTSRLHVSCLSAKYDTKETNKVPVTNPKEMESYNPCNNYDLPDNELKIITLMTLN